MGMHLQRKKTKMYKIATPMTVLLLASMAGTANMVGIDNNGGPIETGEALIHLLIPSVTYLTGSCLAIFGGSSPVGPIPKNWRIAGAILMLISIAWIVGLSLQPENMPVKVASMNDIAVSSLLISTSLIGAIGTTVVFTASDKKWIAGISTISLSIGCIVLLAIFSQENPQEIGDSLTSIIGTILGLIIALWIAFHITVLIERGAKLPNTTSPISEEEKIIVKNHLRSNVEGEKK